MIFPQNSLAFSEIEHALIGSATINWPETENPFRSSRPNWAGLKENNKKCAQNPNIVSIFQQTQNFTQQISFGLSFQDRI